MKSAAGHLDARADRSIWTSATRLCAEISDSVRTSAALKGWEPEPVHLGIGSRRWQVPPGGPWRRGWSPGPPTSERTSGRMEALSSQLKEAGLRSSCHLTLNSV